MKTTIDEVKVHGATLSPELRRRMIDEGGEEMLVWHFRTRRHSQGEPSGQPPDGTPAQTPEAPPAQTADAPHVQPSDTPPVEPAAKEDDAEKTNIDATERQRRQTLRDADKGWARCFAKAPDDPDAREIVAMVAKAIKSLPIRRAVRLAVTHPQYAFMGEKAAGLRGIRGMVVRKLIGATDDIADA